MEALFDDAVATFGRLDVYFTIAGISPVGTAVTTSYEDYKKVVALDMDSVFLGSKYCIPHMIKTGGGVILNLVGTYGIRPTPNMQPCPMTSSYPLPRVVSNSKKHLKLFVLHLLMVAYPLSLQSAYPALAGR